MGCFPNKKKNMKKTLCEKDFRGLAEKIRLLQLEINEMMCVREKESRAFEREVMVFAFKEAEWKEERKRLKAEMKSLKKMVEEKEEMIKDMAKPVKDGDRIENIGGFVEQMREERARRDETVEKWKKLYLAIKIELDDLIQRTHGDNMYWRSKEENITEELKKEVKEKEDKIQSLKAQIAVMEGEQHRAKTQLDILKQSLRIVSNYDHVGKKL